MNEWSELVECLVELDLAIEDRDSWATTPEDVTELRQLEALRGELQAALADRRISPGLRKSIRERRDEPRRVTLDPRD